MQKSYFILWLLLAAVLGFGIYFSYSQKQSDLTTAKLLGSEHFYTSNVQPIFNSRCVACHSCFNSPCQADFSSYEGVMRGGNKISIYDFPKLENRPPTRLFVDAHSPEEWRKKGFYPIVKTTPSSSSILDFMTTGLLGIESGKQNAYHAETSRTCVASLAEKEINAFRELNPAGRMPYGLPPLSESQIRDIQLWQTDGAHGPKTVVEEEKIRNYREIAPLIKTWEDFLNRKTLKEQLSARYFYEHLFLAHIYFNKHPKVFFKLVRSKSRHGDVDEIATTFPFDNPGHEFYYRLRPVINTLTHKVHTPFEFSEEKRERWEKSFYRAAWEEVPKVMPPYGRPGSNPFKTFQAIPAESRYQFFLDDASYHIMTFIKGPVCRGQTALNVINDHFWVMFMSPKEDVLVQSPKTYAKVAGTMEMPAEINDDFSPFVNFREKYWNGVNIKYDYLAKNKKVFEPAWIWDGEGKNTNALITVYRHFDSAMVLRGLRGEIPKTVWVLDYQVFESIYYNLTAGYNVFGPLLHQLNSRLYMEISRIAAEDLFLSFLPSENRQVIRSSWNLPAPDKKDASLKKQVEKFVTEKIREKILFNYNYPEKNIQSSFRAKTKDSKGEFLAHMIKYRFPETIVASTNDIFRENGDGRKSDLDHDALVRIVDDQPKSIRYLPDAIHLRVKQGKKDLAFTMIHNKSHYNVGMLTMEDERRNPEKDTVDIIPGVASSYVNLFMILESNQMDEFRADLMRAKNEKEVWSWLKKYGLSRSNEYFWKNYEWFSGQSANPISNELGWLDLNRYMNI